MKRARVTVSGIACTVAVLTAAPAVWADVCPPPDAVRIGHKGDFVDRTDFGADNESKVSSWTGVDLTEDAKAEFLSHLVCHYSTDGGTKVTLQTLAGAQVKKRVADLPAWTAETREDGSTVYTCTKSLLDCHWF